MEATALTMLIHNHHDREGYDSRGCGTLPILRMENLTIPFTAETQPLTTTKSSFSTFIKQQDTQYALPFP